MSSTSPFQRVNKLSKARWIKNVDPTKSSETADVTTAAIVKVTLRLKLAHVSRNA